MIPFQHKLTQAVSNRIKRYYEEQCTYGRGQGRSLSVSYSAGSSVGTTGISGSKVVVPMAAASPKGTPGLLRFNAVVAPRHQGRNSKFVYAIKDHRRRLDARIRWDPTKWRRSVGMAIAGCGSGSGSVSHSPYHDGNMHVGSIAVMMGNRLRVPVSDEYHFFFLTLRRD
jgi:hypothetical protein